MPRTRKTKQELRQYQLDRMANHNLNTKEFLCVKDTYKNFAKNKSDEVDIDQLKEALNSFNIELRDEKINELFSTVDKKGKVNIDFDQLIEDITNGIDLNSDSLSSIFLYLLGDDATIDALELNHLKELCGNTYSDEEIEEMFKRADFDGDGRINFEDFCKIVGERI